MAGRGNPKGSNGGGGRRKGTPNKITLVRAAQVAEVARATGKKLGVEIMEEAANYFFGLAARHQPTGPDPNPTLFREYLKDAADYASKLAPYQSHRLSSITIQRNPVDLSKLTNAELEQFIGLVTKSAIAERTASGEGTTQH